MRMNRIFSRLIDIDAYVVLPKKYMSHLLRAFAAVVCDGALDGKDGRMRQIQTLSLGKLRRAMKPCDKHKSKKGEDNKNSADAGRIHPKIVASKKLLGPT